MRTHDDLIRLGQVCEQQADATLNEDTAAALREIGERYFQQAAALKAEQSAIERSLFMSPRNCFFDERPITALMQFLNAKALRN